MSVPTNRMNAIARKTVFSCLLLFGCAVLAHGQSVTGAIRGTVTDSSGGLVAGATVTITGQSTGVTSTATSSSTGGYNFELLPLGAYKVEVAASGFKTTHRDNVVVDLGNIVGLDLRLEVGESSQTIDVTESTPILKTEQGQTASSVSAEAFEALPLSAGAGRSPAAFTALTPGVNTNDPSSTNGGMAKSGQYTIDGITVQNLENYGQASNSVSLIRTPPEAIQEMSVVSSAYNAEYGNTAGGVQRYTIKSGTNVYHGNAYEYFKNTSLDARSFFAKERSIDRQNEYGFSLGGPVSIPKVYNGKNKSFFFWNADWYRTRGGSKTSTISLPNAGARTGDFSGYLGKAVAGATNNCTGGSVLTNQVFDPNSTQTVGGQICRTPFAGNIIPPSRISPTALATYAVMPATTTQDILLNTVLVSQPSTSEFDDYTIKWDQYFGSNHHLNGSFVKSGAPSTSGYSVPPPLGGNSSNLNAFDYARLTHDWVVKPTLVNEFALGYNRFIYTHDPFGQVYPGWQKKLGVPGYDLASNIFPGMLWDASDYQTFGNAQFWYSVSNTYVLVDSLSWNKGRHNIKVGVEMQNLTNSQQKDWPAQMTFSRNSTALPTALGSTGQAAASFDLGLMSNSVIQQLSGTNAGYVNRYIMEYVQDDWKIRPRLTLNLGFRVETYTPQSVGYPPPNSFLSGVNLSKPNPAAGGLPGTYVFANVDGEKNCLSSGCKKATGYAPRFGAAWRATDRTVVRLGYGISYFPTGLYGAGDNIFSTDGYNPTSTAVSPDTGVTPAATFATGFPPNRLQTRSLGPEVNLGTNFQFWGYAAQTISYAQSWNVSFQAQLASNLSLDLAYVGTKGTHLTMATNINQLDPKYLSLGTPLLQSKITSPAAIAAGFKQPWAGFSDTLGASATVAQSLRPFPQYLSGFAFNSDNYGNNTYHALQAKLDKRYAKGLYFLGAFSWSKSIGNANTSSLPLPGNNTLSKGTVPNQFDFRSQRGVSQLWQPVVLTIAANYDLPIGPGRQFLTKGGVLGSLTGGWRLGSVMTFRTGALLSVTQPSNLPLFAGPQYANPVVGVAALTQNTGKFDPNTMKYLNVNAFSLAPAGTFGTGNQYLPNVFAPFYQNLNISLTKTTQITERLSAQFRLETFNSLNHPIFAGPAADISNPSSFGKITTEASTPRQCQLVLKISF
ncbi:MAG: carboxypeptidase regulatory-like domain-containing protein [Terriglobia bacterium]